MHFHRQIIIDELKKFEWKSLLEVGTGWGKNIEMIRENFPNTELHGCDKDSYPKSSLCDIKLLPFKDDGYDAVLVDAVLMYIDKPELAIKEVKRVAKKIIIICDQKISRLKDYLPSDVKMIKIEGWGGDWDKDGYIIIWKK